MTKHYAFAHPGKIGDALYTLPTIHTICERDDAVAHFYTSEVCRPLEKLFRYQEHIEDFIIPPNYKIESFGQGVQPWQMPVPIHDYDGVFQLGFKKFPRGPLHHFIAREAGLNNVPNPKYQFPETIFYNQPYIVVGFSGERGYPPMKKDYEQFVQEIGKQILVVQTGTEQDRLAVSCEDQIGLDLLDTLSLLHRSQMFIGFYSGLLALANGFPDLWKVVTLTSPNCGEQHGLHINNTVHVLFKEHQFLNALTATVYKYL
jgi:ADP-heptose:LPS heptosyltransferase